MPRLPLHPSSGVGIVTQYQKSIRFARYGCTNRPFYHIVVMDTKLDPRRPPIEQLGTYDPIPNMYNEKLVSFNFERIQYWLGRGVSVTKPIAELLGFAGFFPIHPKSYMRAWRRRKVREQSSTNESETQAATN